MPNKITIITPVHVGTGEEKLCFEYQKEDGYVYHYNLQELFNTIPDSVLLDQKFLMNLKTSQNNQSKRDELNRVMTRNADYSKVQPDYELMVNFDDQLKKNIVVQAKSLNRPYIPGSTIKGAIINAIHYDFVKEHYEDFKDYLKYMIDEGRTKKISIDDFFKDYFREYKASELTRLMHQFKSCILCSDVFFDDMVLVHAQRKKVTDGKNLPLPDYECIEINQVADGVFIKIDTKKKEILKLNDSEHVFFDELEKYLSSVSIIKVCRDYFKAMMNEEVKMEEKYHFYNLECIQELYDSKIKNTFYLRVGKNTNYFFKSISYLVKTKSPKFFEKYFYRIFSPVQSLKSKTKPKVETMPVSRTTYEDDYESYYPGVIKVEFYKES